MAGTRVQQKFDVGGVLLDRPFKIRRLGHFGLDLSNLEAGLPFYRDLLGFAIADPLDFAARAPDPTVLAGLGDTNGYFMRYGSDHHAFVIFPKRVREALGRGAARPRMTINQITWQVGSLREVGHAVGWFEAQGIRIARSGRDTPGSNWHTYIYDPDDHVNELYYGIEQIGWTGRSKPRAMYTRGFQQAPPLPQIGELDEVQQALAGGIDLLSGFRDVESFPARFDVDGILLPRPFKIVRLGPVRLFVEDVEAAQAFYEGALGFMTTEELVWQGQRCVFLRANTEHHAIALYPVALREALSLSGHTTLMAIGLQLANYRQLREAKSFFEERGVSLLQVPPELSPGIDYSIYLRDPDGHAVQLYAAMEQIGWNGRPRPAQQRRPAQVNDLPDTIERQADAYLGEPFLGPWG
jgi:catechol 2,3-dioxygenase-like lactoylglutathione lyase family enzyme